MALSLVNVLLLASVWLNAGAIGPAFLSLETLLLVGVFALLPQSRWSRVVATITACAIVLLVAAATADAAVRQILARPLNLYLDVHLLDSVVNLLTGALGPAMGLLVAATTAVVGGLLIWLLAFVLYRVGTRAAGLRVKVPGLVLVISFAVIVGLRATRTDMPSLARHTALPAVTVATDQTRHLTRMLREREVFLSELALQPPSYADLPGLLGRLGGRDVVLAFIESYGMSALEDPRYAPILRPRLDELEDRMATARLHLTSGSLIAPTQGGQSWFSHASLLSGTWLDNQLRYDLLIASGRETLIDDFRRAGYRTVALMPAITMAWPEGDRLGYDQVLAHKDIDYSGPPLNWVTMPDQFTWSFLEHSVRIQNGTDRRPVFAEISLISSHAPWTPILPVIDDWDTVRDGSIFASWENAGERPADLWRDTERVREHFALSVDYAVAAMTAYAERFLDGDTLLIVLGDHQPAPLITGDDASRAVPVHVISGDPTLVGPFAEWGFQPGAFPDPAQTVRRMDKFRDWFVRTFSSPGVHAIPVVPSRSDSP